MPPPPPPLFFLPFFGGGPDFAAVILSTAGLDWDELFPGGGWDAGAASLFLPDFGIIVQPSFCGEQGILDFQDNSHRRYTVTSLFFLLCPQPLYDTISFNVTRSALSRFCMSAGNNRPIQPIRKQLAFPTLPG